MFSVCLILFHFILFLSNFTPVGRVVFFSLFGVCFVLAAGGQFQWVRDCKSKLNLNPMEEDSTVCIWQGVTLEHT